MFLHPLMLLGVAAVGVPIVIHLLNNRRFERVKFAAMRFLRASVQKNQRRMKIEDLLLLILRCAMLALLAVALARPALRGGAGWLGQGGVTAVVVLDHSYSMTATDGVASRFDRAKQAAEQVIRSLPGGSSAAIWLGDEGVTPLIPEPTFDLNLATRAVREAAPSDRTSDAPPVLRAALEALARKAVARRELYFITDGQRLGWSRLDDVRALLDGAEADVKTTIILTPTETAQNLGVSDLREASGLCAVDRPLRFSVQVTNYGSGDAAGVRVGLSIDGQPPMDEATIDSIAPGQSRSVSLFGRLRGEGHHTVTASVAPDRLPADDSRTIAVRAVGKVKVLLVDGDAGREPREAETFFLRHALAPVSLAERERHFVEPVVVAAAQLATTNLDEYEAVVLANVVDVSPGTLDALAAYLARGGGLIVFPGEKTRIAFYNEQLLEKHAFLPASLGQPKGDPAAPERLLSLAGKGFDHPISALWNEPAAGSPSAASFYRVFLLTPAPKVSADDPRQVGDPRVVLAFSDGSPAVMERRWGQGRVVLFASTADTAWNDLAARPGIFVPLLYRTLGAIVSRQDEALNVRVGQKATIPQPLDLLGRDVMIRPPGLAKEAAPDTRRVELAGHAAALQYERTDRAGAYEVVIPDAAGVKFAAQADPRESDLAMLSDEQLRQLAASAGVVRWSDGALLEQTIETARTGTELWLPIAVVVLMIALVETGLAHWFSRPK